jgi:hypothetical protein
VLASVASADCRAFFVKRPAVVVQQVAVPVAVYPPVYYSAGADIQAEALAVKVAALVEAKLSLRQQQTAPAPNAFTKCAQCHTGPNAAVGLVLDGSPLDCHVYKRWGEIAGLGKNVPAKMQGLVSSLTPEQKGQINEAILLLVADKPKPTVADGELQ